VKISILCHDLSANSIVRTYPIAKVLQRNYEVEVIGIPFAGEVFAPYKREFDYKTIRLTTEGGKLSFSKTERFPGFLRAMKQLANLIEGDAIYAFKPLLPSFGVGLMAKYLKGIPLVLDIEDWDAEAFVHSNVRTKLTSLKLPGILYPKNEWQGFLLEHAVGLADQITVVSDFLKKKFGGIKLPHGADTRLFDPRRYDRARIREKWRLEEAKIVLFAGTAHAHKGVEDLVVALKAIRSPSARLMIVGKRTPYQQELVRHGNGRIISIGPRPHSEMPQILSVADLIVLPQRNTPYAQAQVPGKVFEAMAMAKPIIATRVSDLPEILDGCGWIIQPENPSSLAKAIQHALNNPQESCEKGQKARQRCIAQYSWDSMEQTLTSIFERIKPRSRPLPS